MRILGLDVGSKTIGVAVSDELGITAQGAGVLKRQSWTLDLAQVAELIRRYAPQEIVIGFPKNMNGSLGPQAAAAARFAERLAAVAPGLSIRLWDERLTTVAAQKALVSADVSRQKRRKVVDKLAAMLILQSYLDWRRQASSEDCSGFLDTTPGLG